MPGNLTKEVFIKDSQYRINEQIRASKVRLVGPDGSQVGVVPIEQALRMAEENDLDLVEVAPNVDPPVCKIMDFGKFRYELTKKERDQRKRQHVIHVKEIRLRPKTDDHDIVHKIRHARRFLEEGNRLKITIMFRGREMIYKEFGYQLLERVKKELSDVAKLEKGPVEEGRNLVAFFMKK